MREKPATVFVVDDDSGVRSSIRMLLKSVGIAATPIASAQEFLAAFDPAQPGCLGSTSACPA
jgi:FixJ family two-component response regulator